MLIQFEECFLNYTNRVYNSNTSIYFGFYFLVTHPVPIYLMERDRMCNKGFEMYF